MLEVSEASRIGLEGLDAGVEGFTQRIGNAVTNVNVIYLAGLKFGSNGAYSAMWAMNTWLPGVVCRKFRSSRIVAYSTGNVYGATSVVGGGSRETDPVQLLRWVKRTHVDAVAVPLRGVLLRLAEPRKRRLNYIHMTPEQRLAELQLALPPAPKPAAVYKPLLIVDRLAYVSGHGPVLAEGTLITGVVGRDLSLEQGYAAARQTGLTILATLREQLGTLDRVKRVVKLLGMVNSAPDFYEQPKVINGCSELFVEIWGPENGIGTRSAVGLGPLPGNIAVEIEGIFELH